MRTRLNILILLTFCLLMFLQINLAQIDSSQQLGIGFEYIKTRNFQSAYKTFKEILDKDSGNDQARRGLVIALIGIDKFAEASREIAKLLAKFPNDINLLEISARTFWQQKRYVEAEIVLKRRLNLNAENGELWALYGDVSDAQKKTDQAISAYQKAVSLKPDSITLLYALGSLFWKSIRYDEAEKVFLDILQRQPNEPRSSFNLGDIYLTKGEFAKAVPLLEVAAKAFPAEFDTRFALGRAYLATNKPAPAITEFESAIKLNDQVSEGYFYLGRALQRVGRKDDAKKAVIKAQELQKQKLASESLELKKPK
jgi:tetratricopeptide (TPR) repeat protein